MKVLNQAGITPELKPESPNTAPLYMRGHGERQHPLKTEKLVPPGDEPALSRYCDVRQAAPESGDFPVSAWNTASSCSTCGTSGTARRPSASTSARAHKTWAFAIVCPILFHGLPAVKVVLGVKDFDGQPTTAAFTFRDNLGRVYPNPARQAGSRFFLS